MYELSDTYLQFLCLKGHIDLGITKKKGKDKKGNEGRNVFKIVIFQKIVSNLLKTLTNRRICSRKEVIFCGGKFMMIFVVMDFVENGDIFGYIFGVENVMW